MIGGETSDYLAVDDLMDLPLGSKPACKWVRLACQRHLDDLARSKDNAYPYRFEQAERVCRFVELLPHTKGKWAAKGDRITLEPWQCFKAVVIFGWLRKADGYRRFRKALILEPRKNGLPGKCSGRPASWRYVQLSSAQPSG